MSSCSASVLSASEDAASPAISSLMFSFLMSMVVGESFSSTVMVSLELDTWSLLFSMDSSGLLGVVLDSVLLSLEGSSELLPWRRSRAWLRRCFLKDFRYLERKFLSVNNMLLFKLTNF